MSKEQFDLTNYYLDLLTEALHQHMQNGDLDKADTGPKYPTFIHPDEPGYPAQ